MWKEQLSEEYGAFNFAPQISKPGHDSLISFISQEIIEKLIEDIALTGTEVLEQNDIKPYSPQWWILLRQQLRDKWLS
jgi:hypothetical protein